MTGKIINITNKLDREPTFIEIDGSMYKVDNSKTAVINFMGIQKKSEAGEIEDAQAIDEALKIFLSPEKFAEIDKKNPDWTYNNWQILFFACLASAMNKPYEEVEASFRKATNG